MIITTADEIRVIEEKENEIGTDFLTLMERAGTGCAELIRQSHAPGDGPVIVFVGRGKNGGDGYVIARKLRETGYSTAVIRAFGPPKAEDAVINEARALEAGVPVLDWPDPKAKEVFSKAGLLVDCMFGIGFRGAANEQQAEVFCALNESPAKTVSVDVPSGVVTDTGEVLGVAVQAEETFSMSTLKPLHVFYPAREYCGDISVLDIGLLPASYAAAAPTLRALSDAEAEALLPTRARTAHKNDAGHVLSLCGSVRMPGAACLCANAAVRAGAGLLTAAYPEPAYPAISSHLTECMSLPLPADDQGRLSLAALPEVLSAMESRTVLAAGPGLGQSPELRQLLMGLLEQCDKPMVLDADALNALAGDADVLKDHAGPVVITPHPGEMARLLGVSVSEVQKDRRQTAATVANEYGVTVLLKGPDTVIAAFLAEGAAPQTAAALGAFYHGKAAAYCAETRALRSILATDLIEALPFVLPD